MRMFKFSTSHLKKKIGFELIDRTYGIRNDEKMMTALEELLGIDNDEGPCYYEIDNVLPHFFDFNIEWVDIPEGVAYEHIEDCSYWLQCAFSIPKLIPHTNHPDFNKIAEDFYRRSSGFYIGNSLELVYLPHSDFVESTDPVHREFGNQPGTFIIGIQDNGGINEDTIIEFMNELRDFNRMIKEIITGEERDS